MNTINTIASAGAIIALLMVGSEASIGQDQIKPAGEQIIPVGGGDDAGAVLKTGAVIHLLIPGSEEAMGQDQCSTNSKHTIQIREGSDGRPEVAYRSGSAKKVQVCLGDTVQWLLNGPSRKYFVEFGEGSPVLGAARHGSTDNVVKVTIGGAVQSGGSYEYIIEFPPDAATNPRNVVD